MGGRTWLRNDDVSKGDTIFSTPPSLFPIASNDDDDDDDDDGFLSTLDSLDALERQLFLGGKCSLSTPGSQLRMHICVPYYTSVCWARPSCIRRYVPVLIIIMPDSLQELV